jgi:sec-independent protein translocase protein TatA
VNLFRSLGPLELLIILAIVILIFGPGRLGRIAGEMGRGIRNFRRGMAGDDEATEEADESVPEET